MTKVQLSLQITAVWNKIVSTNDDELKLLQRKFWIKRSGRYLRNLP